MLRRFALALLLVALATPRALAGPPFVTDDPVPTDYRHWEIYTGLLYENDGFGNDMLSDPFAEFNYGALPNVQTSASFQHSLVEAGIKTRIVQGAHGWPQIAFYPSVQISTLPGVHAVTFLPLWMQKSWGPWTAFGGGGEYLTSGNGTRDSTFVGAALERTLSPGTTVGAELFHQSPQTLGGSDTTAFNIGAIFEVGQYHAILLSFGRALHGVATFTGYASYEFALGPQP